MTKSEETTGLLLGVVMSFGISALLYQQVYLPSETPSLSQDRPKTPYTMPALASNCVKSDSREQKSSLANATIAQLLHGLTKGEAQ